MSIHEKPTIYNAPNIYKLGGSGGGGTFGIDNIVTIVPINKMVVVDSNGYIGFNLTNYFQTIGAVYYYNYAILSLGDNFSDMGMGQVTFYTPASSDIGGRVYNTVVIGGKEWMAENLDFKFSGLAVNPTYVASSPCAYYYNYSEATYGVNGNKYGLLYNWYAAKYLNDNRAQLIPGWHVPTRAEWNALATAVGGASVAGTKIKSTTGWSSGNGDGSYGFNSFPTGRMENNMQTGAVNFAGVGNYTYLWTPELNTGSYAYSKKLTTAAAMADDNFSTAFFGCSIRLVRDTQ